MRKRSTQEILQLIEVRITGDTGDNNVDQEKVDKTKRYGGQARLDNDPEQRKRDKLKLDREKFEYQKQQAKDKAEKRKSDENIKTQKGKLTALQNRAKQTASTPNKYGLGKKETTTNKDGSVTATGKVGMNMLRTGVTAVSAARSGINRLRAARQNMKLKKMRADRAAMDNPPTKPPGSSTPPKPKITGDVQKKPGMGERIKTAVTNTRRTTGRGIEKVGSAGQRAARAGQRFGRKLANEDFIHEAENDKKEIKKEKIDVMKGKNKIEVNPKSLPEETMSPAQKRKDTNLKKKYDDSEMKQNMIDQYGEEEGEKVYYATIRKQAMKTESVSGLEVQNVSDGIKFREYEFIDVVKPEPMKSPKNNITWTEAKVPEGLMKLAATVADNNKKRKNALQIQKYIGEDAKTGRMSDDDLAAAHKKISGMDQSMPSNQHMLKRINREINKRKKANPKPEIEEGKGSNPNKRYIGDPIVTSKKSFTQTGKIGIEYETPQEKYDAEQRRKRTADPMKTYKKNKSMEKAAQNMQMIKRMTPEQKYARKMRIKQQQKDKK